MFIPREGLLCERQLLPVPASLHNLFQIHLREDEAHCVLCLHSAKECRPPRPRRAVVCLTVPAGIRLRDWPMPVSYRGLTSAPVGPPPPVHSGVMCGARDPPCPVSTLESWAAPVIFPAPCLISWRGEVSWVFSSCGRQVGYILELRRGCPF